MRRSKKSSLNLIILCVLYTLLTGCLVVNKSSASIERIYQDGREVMIQIGISKATYEWHFTAHGDFGNLVEHYSFAIPSWPTTLIAFAAGEIRVMDISRRTKDIPPLTAGEIVVDPIKKEVVVALKTSKGEFPGNGVYPITYFSK